MYPLCNMLLDGRTSLRYTLLSRELIPFLKVHVSYFPLRFGFSSQSILVFEVLSSSLKIHFVLEVLFFSSGRLLRFCFPPQVFYCPSRSRPPPKDARYLQGADSLLQGAHGFQDPCRHSILHPQFDLYSYIKFKELLKEKDNAKRKKLTKLEQLEKSQNILK